MTELTDKVIDELKKKGINVTTIRIVPTAADLKRHEEVDKYIKYMEEAHRQTGKSTLRFGYQTA